MKSKDLYYLIFIEGFVVLSLQILSAVVLTPFWGGSFMFWSLELFFVMLGLSTAYYITPSLFSKPETSPVVKLRKTLLYSFFYLSGLFAFSDKLLSFFISAIQSPLAGMIVSLVFFIYIPLSLIGSIPVLVIAAGKSKKEVNGESERTGIVFFISSVSGILAVLFLSFLALPWWGLSYSLSLVILVLALGLFIFLNRESKRKSILIIPVVALLLTVFLIVKEKNAAQTNLKNPKLRVAELQNGVMGQLKVIENKVAQEKILYVNNSMQSKSHLSGRSLFPYVYSMVMYSRCKPAGSSVLLAGMGAGNLIYEYNRMNYAVDVVDIDGRLPGLVERNFLLPAQKLNFIESDVRRYIKKQEKKYDVIVFDLSKAENVPTNVYTLECFRECKKNLAPGGILLIHFLSSMSDDGKVALASVKKTIKEAGFRCELMNYKNQKHLLDGVIDTEKPEGYILMASEKIDLSGADFRIDTSLIAELIPQKDHLFLVFDESEGYVLTDDKPLLDILQAKNSMTMRKKNIKAIVEMNKHAK